MADSDAINIRDFELFKRLTALRETETMSIHDVMRKLVGLPPAGPIEAVSGPAACVLKGVTLPNGTQLRAIYKGQTYTAEIQNGRWVDASGETRTSPSQAADKITGKSYNGWRFWQVKRPADETWRLLDDLR